MASGRSAEESSPVPVVVMGLGSIGQEIARAAARTPELTIIGAVDSNPSLVGKKLSDVVKAPVATCKVVRSLKEAVGARKGVVLLHATGSRIPHVMGQLKEAMNLGLSVVSTCEELSFPWFRHPELTDELEALAKKKDVTILGTGVNPGFVLDRLPAMLGQVCGPIRRVTARRVVDARTRRVALQRKIGGGLTEDEFFELVDKEQLGHVGLVESAALCALGCGIDCDDFEEEIVPVIAEEKIVGAFEVKPGRVAGIHQTAIALEDGQERVRLELTIALGADDPGDFVEIDADPKVALSIKGGVAGDGATANLVVNAAPRLSRADAGVITVLDLPVGR